MIEALQQLPLGLRSRPAPDVPQPCWVMQHLVLVAVIQLDLGIGAAIDLIGGILGPEFTYDHKLDKYAWSAEAATYLTTQKG